MIPNFLDCSEYRRKTDPALRARLCPPDRYDAAVIHISNFRPVKRAAVALDVFRAIRRSVRARFLLVGDGPDRAEVERRAVECGLEDEVVFLGEQHDLVALLSISDLFLLPSVQESFGLAALEAMACGVPVVASNVGGLPEIIQDGITGFACPPDDVDGMARHAVALLTDPDLHAGVAMNAASMVRTRYLRGTDCPGVRSCVSPRPRIGPRRPYQSTLTPNCSWRGVFACEVTTPNEPEVTLVFGDPNCTRFSALNASIRAWTFILPGSAKFLKTDKSTLRTLSVLRRRRSLRRCRT